MLVIETQYFPSVQFFTFLVQNKSLCLEKYENYTKQTYRNRCYILGANKVERLTVPVFSAENGQKQLITDVQLDNRQNWQQTHWRSIKSAYGKSPFFPYYADMIETALFLPTETLFQLNENIIKTLLKILATSQNISQTINYTENYQQHYQQNNNSPFIDKRNQTETVNAVNFTPYAQVFGNEFVSNLSVLDLIFCKGNYASFDKI